MWNPFKFQPFKIHQTTSGGMGGGFRPSYQGINPGTIMWTPSNQPPKPNPFQSLLAAYGSTLSNWQNRPVAQANIGLVTNALPTDFRTSGETAALMSKLALGRGERELERLGSETENGFYTDEAQALWRANLGMDKYKQDLAKQRQEEAFKQQMIDVYTQKLSDAWQQSQAWNKANRPKSNYEQYLEMARKSKHYDKNGRYIG